MTETQEQAQAAPTIERHRKVREGVVVKSGAEKTIVVQVMRRVKHPRYNKYTNRRRRYAVHDLIGCGIGDNVMIQETRPLSKRKRWKVVKKLPKHA